MPERIQAILNRIREWWEKFTAKQKAAIISGAAVVIIALIILIVIFARPKTRVLKTASDAAEAETIQTLLKDNDISYTQSTDGMTFSVKESDYGQASILLGSQQIATNGYTIKDALDGSFSTTEADTEKKYQLYLDKKFEANFTAMDNVKAAEVNLHIPKDDGTITSSANGTNEASASVKLTLSGSMSKSQARSLAQFMATNLGNSDLSKITIIDNDGNTLFSGAEDNSTAVQASDNLQVKANAENYVADKVKSTLASNNSGSSSTSIYDNLQVAVNLDIDFSQSNSVSYEYSAPDGRTEGMKDSETTEESQSTNGVAGTPGTDSNDDTEYAIEDGNQSSSSSSKSTVDYLPNEVITTKTGAQGVVSYDNSSISIIATDYVTYDEDTLKANGKLKNQTFDEFRAKNSDEKQIDVDDSIVTAVSRATGIPTANISVIAKQVPLFQYSKNGRGLTDYLQIIIALLVFALLGIIVFRSLKKDQEEEVEEEVSVEDLMAQKQEEEEPLEDIGFNEKSEARLLIEKFVDEEPEAVANLLRNWLNDDWS
jgi:flagellar M-ring protein FliF